MGRRSRYLGALLAALAAPSLAHATIPSECSGPVARVNIRSDVEVAEPQILLAAARIEPGEVLREEVLQRALRALRATGRAGTVEAYCDRANGAVVLDLVLRGSVQVESVELVGDLGLKRRDLEPFVPQKSREPLVEDRVIRGVYRLQDQLHASGFLGATVRIDIDVEERSKRARVIYEIEAGRRWSVGEVDLDGDLTAEESSDLRGELKRGSGATYSRTVIRREPERLERRLRGAGYLRAVVGEPEETLDPDAAVVDLRYPIDTGPKIDVVVHGAELKTLRRRGLLPFLDGAGFDDALIVQSRNAIERHFQSKGYYDVEVASDQPVEGDAVRLTFTIDRGRKWTLEDLRFAGNAALSTDELEQRVETTPGRPLVRGGGRLVDDTLSSDLENLLSFYALRGFPGAQVGPAEIVRQGGGSLEVEIPIVEGERQRVVDIGFDGIERIEREVLLGELFLEPGGPYHPLLLDESINAIRAVYQESGFASVVIEPKLDWDEGLVDVVFQVDEGPRTVVEGIILRGNQTTDAEIVRRAMGLERGAPVSARSLLEVQRRLYGLGIFSRVSVNTVPGTPYSSGRDVLVRMDEGKRNKVTYGLGWDSEDGVRGLFGYSRNNLFGRGVSARFDLQASERDRQARVLFRQPYIGLREVPIRYSLFRVEEEQDSFDSRRGGVQIEASRRLGRTQWSLLYTFKVVDTELKPPLVELDRELANVEISSLTPSFFVDRRNDPVNPTRGATSNVQLEYAFPLLSADSHEFAKLFAQRTAYIPLDRYGTLAASLRFGGIEPIGGDNIVDPTVPEGVPSRLIPISERLFGGGPSTHRAFRLDQLAIEGESATDGAAFGGSGLLLLNLDYRFPLSGALEGTVFFDTGNVWGDWRDIALDETRHGAGVGVRYLSPIGPLRVEIGWKLDREPGESSREIFISFGHPF